MEAIAHARTGRSRMERGNVSVAVVVAWSGVVQNAKAHDIAALEIELDDLIAVLSFASIPVVHANPQLVGLKQFMILLGG